MNKQFWQDTQTNQHFVLSQGEQIRTNSSGIPSQKPHPNHLGRYNYFERQQLNLNDHVDLPPLTSDNTLYRPRPTKHVGYTQTPRMQISPTSGLQYSKKNIAQISSCLTVEHNKSAAIKQLLKLQQQKVYNSLDQSPLAHALKLKLKSVSPGASVNGIILSPVNKLASKRIDRIKRGNLGLSTITDEEMRRQIRLETERKFQGTVTANDEIFIDVRSCGSSVASSQAKGLTKTNYAMQLKFRQDQHNLQASVQPTQVKLKKTAVTISQVLIATNKQHQQVDTAWLKKSNPFYYEGLSQWEQRDLHFLKSKRQSFQFKNLK